MSSALDVRSGDFGPSSWNVGDLAGIAAKLSTSLRHQSGNLSLESLMLFPIVSLSQSWLPKPELFHSSSTSHWQSKQHCHNTDIRFGCWESFAVMLCHVVPKFASKFNNKKVKYRDKRIYNIKNFC